MISCASPAGSAPGRQRTKVRKHRRKRNRIGQNRTRLLCRPCRKPPHPGLHLPASTPLPPHSCLRPADPTYRKPHGTRHTVSGRPLTRTKHGMSLPPAEVRVFSWLPLFPFPARRRAACTADTGRTVSSCAVPRSVPTSHTASSPATTGRAEPPPDGLPAAWQNLSLPPHRHALPLHGHLTAAPPQSPRWPRHLPRRQQAPPGKNKAEPFLSGTAPHDGQLSAARY